MEKPTPTKDEVIAFYDSFLPKLSQENNRHRRIYQSLDTLPKGKTLDIGCGAGLTSKHLAQGGRQVTGIDISPVAISHAKRHNFHEAVEYICADIATFRFDEKYDVICMIDVVEHLEKQDFINVLLNMWKSWHDNTVIYVNIPYYYTALWLKDNYPEVMQPIDHAHSVSRILDQFSYVGFIPYRMEMFWAQYVEYFFCTEKRFSELMATTFQSLKRSNGNG